MWYPQLSVYASVSEHININYEFENVSLFVQWNVFSQLLRIKFFLFKLLQMESGFMRKALFNRSEKLICPSPK